ncbi:MAG: tetratricopeptide repeat protein [Bacteroidales bacterium]|jgi:tetratricopeptide (TPR) repeat protein|nr:tetratricopeptide repeat protein [Bacteroidales bacterium]
MTKRTIPQKNKQKDKKNTGEIIYHFPVVYVILFLLILLVYGQTFWFQLGKLDETNIILNKLGFLSDFRNLKEVFLTNPFFNKGGDFYRPLQNITFMIDAHLSGKDGWAYYLSNILIHFVTCSLIFYLLTLFGKNRKIALFLTLIFSIHPLFVQTVAWAPSRGDLLLSMFGISSFVFFIRYIREKNYLFLVLCVLSFALALISKETAVIIPVICLLYFLFIEKEKRVSLTGLIIPAVSCISLFLLFMYIRNEIVGIVVEKGQFGIWPFTMHLRTIPEFISKFFLPLDLGPMPAFKLFPTIFGSLILILLTCISARSQSVSGKLFWFGLVWFLLFTIPTITYVNKFGSASCDYMEHRAYLPLVGILLFLFQFFSISHKFLKTEDYSVILFFIIPVFAAYSFLYSRNYKTPMTYYNRAVKNNPVSAIAYANRGITRMSFNEDYRGAIEDYDHTIYLLPDYAASYNNRGLCKEHLRDTLGAIADYENASRKKPGWDVPHINLASLKHNMGLIHEAIREYDTALVSSPKLYQIYNERGCLKRESQDYQGALEDLNRALALHPGYPEAFFNRGVLALDLQNYQSAIQDFTRAVQLNTKYVEAYVNRGIGKFRLLDYTGAMEDFNLALSVNDQYAEAYLDRGMARYMIRDLQGACKDWEIAQRLGMAEAENLLLQYCKL